MWKYSEENAHNSISLHDCRTDSIQTDGNDMIIRFPDGFWITPVSPHIDHDRPLKTGPGQLRFKDCEVSCIHLFQTTYLFRRPVLCRRIELELSQFLGKINDGTHELEFLYEFHNSINTLYKCWLWKKNRGMVAECELEINAKSISYHWNEILPDREW